MERLKRLIPVFIICAIPLIITGCKGGFDASGYTGAILDLQFQGDTGSARAMVAGATSENLQDMYQELTSCDCNVISFTFLCLPEAEVQCLNIILGCV